jgi:hypothetical protein
VFPWTNFAVQLSFVQCDANVIARLHRRRTADDGGAVGVPADSISATED